MTQINTASAVATAAATAAPSLSINDVSATAGPGGAPVTFTVTLSKPSPSPVVVSYGTIEGSGSSGGGDYVGVPEATVTIPAGQTSATITIEARAKAVGSVAKTFTVHITAVGVDVARSIGTATLNAPVAPSPIIKVSPSPTPNLNASDDLFTVLQNAKPGSMIVATPGITLSLTQMPQIKAAGVKFNLNGAKLAMSLPPGTTSDIAVRAASFELFGGTILRAVVAVRSWAPDTYLHDLFVAAVDAKAGTAVNTLFLADAGAIDAKLANITCGLVNGVAVYWTADGFGMTDSTFAGSIGEDILRSDLNATTGNAPVNAVLSGITADNSGNAYHKEAIAIRMGKAAISNSGFSRLRAGQSSAKGVGGNATIALTACNFPAIQAGYPQLEIVQGVAFAVEGCTFAGDATESSITIDKLSSGTISGSIRKPTVAGLVLKALISGPGMAGAKETGTVVSG